MLSKRALCVKIYTGAYFHNDRNTIFGVFLVLRICLFDSSHLSADCSRHSVLLSLFPVPTILVTKYKAFYVICFYSGNRKGILYFELWGMMS